MSEQTPQKRIANLALAPQPKRPSRPGPALVILGTASVLVVGGFALSHAISGLTDYADSHSILTGGNADTVYSLTASGIAASFGILALVAALVIMISLQWNSSVARSAK